MAIYTFDCRGCNDPTRREAGKRPTFCEDCAGFRQEWARMRSPSQWRIRSCKGCGVYLPNCEYGGRAYCRECVDRRANRYSEGERQKRPIPDMKCCAHCNVTKRADHFHLTRWSSSGLSCRCKECDRIIQANARKRRSLSPEHCLSERLRKQAVRTHRMGRIGDHVRLAIKRDHRMKLVEEAFGWSIADLKRHLERQFTKGMTWDRFMAGDIHIDHRRPLKSFDLMNDDDLQAAWALTNLSPMWASENIAKGAKLTLLL